MRFQTPRNLRPTLHFALHQKGMFCFLFFHWSHPHPSKYSANPFPFQIWRGYPANSKLAQLLNPAPTRHPIYIYTKHPPSKLSGLRFSFGSQYCMSFWNPHVFLDTFLFFNFEAGRLQENLRPILYFAVSQLQFGGNYPTNRIDPKVDNFLVRNPPRNIFLKSRKRHKKIVFSLGFLLSSALQIAPKSRTRGSWSPTVSKFSLHKFATNKETLPTGLLSEFTRFGSTKGTSFGHQVGWKPPPNLGMPPNAKNTKH